MSIEFTLSFPSNTIVYSVNTGIFFKFPQLPIQISCPLSIVTGTKSTLLSPSKPNVYTVISFIPFQSQCLHSQLSFLSNPNAYTANPIFHFQPQSLQSQLLHPISISNVYTVNPVIPFGTGRYQVTLVTEFQYQCLESIPSSPSVAVFLIV